MPDHIFSHIEQKQQNTMATYSIIHTSVSICMLKYTINVENITKSQHGQENNGWVVVGGWTKYTYMKWEMVYEHKICTILFTNGDDSKQKKR